MVIRALAFLSVFFPLLTHAQAPEGEGEPLTRAITCLSQGNLRCASRGLREVMEQAPSAEAAYYQAVTFRLAGDSLSCSALLRRMLDGEWGALDDARRVRLEAMLASVLEELAHVVVRDVSGPDQASVRLDGREVATWSGEAVELQLNAGRHVVSVSALRYAESQSTVELDLGEHRALSFSLEAIEARPLRQRPAFWAALAAGIVLVGAATAIAFVAANTEKPLRFEGPLGSGSEEI